MSRRLHTLFPFAFPAYQNSAWLGLYVVGAVALLHIIVTWGHIESFSHDAGLWLHQVERFAHGEVPYRDFYWQFPPLGLWVLGWVARLLGSNVTIAWGTTALILLLSVFFYYRYASNLIEFPFTLPIVLGCLLLAFGYVRLHALPLALGTYTPTVTVGFLFLLVALLQAIRLFETGKARNVLVLGLFCGFCVLTKHDFWIPAAYLWICCLAFLLWCGKRGEAVALSAVFLGTVIVGFGAVIVQAQTGALWGILTGWGLMQDQGGRGFPTGKLLLVEFVNLAALASAALVVLLLARATSWSSIRRPLALLLGAFFLLAGLWVSIEYLWRGVPQAAAPGGSYPMGLHVELLTGCFFSLKREMQAHILPFFLPAVALGSLAIFWRKQTSPGTRNAIFFLLGFCIAARLRRGFEFTEWYSFLLEIPVYWLAGQALLRQREWWSRAVPVAASIALILFSCYSYWYYGFGPLARREAAVALSTPKGVIRVTPSSARDFLQLQAILNQKDPTGERPLFVFGYTGGFNYFLNRKNPTPTGQGLRFSPVRPEDVVRVVRQHNPPVFLIDDSGYLYSRSRWPSASLRFWQWEADTADLIYLTLDVRYFRQMIAGCQRFAEVRSEAKRTFTLYDCARGGGP
jgi:hypothetical protein